MKIVNSNYRGYLVDSLEQAMPHCKLATSSNSPHRMTYFSCNKKFKILIFRSKKIRLMGNVEEEEGKLLKYLTDLPFKVKIDKMQSMTGVHDLGHSVNLIDINKKFSHHKSRQVMYEPEIFPAAIRFIRFNPICVNVFATGKVTLMGLKNRSQGNMICDILDKIMCEKV